MVFDKLAEKISANIKSEKSNNKSLENEYYDIVTDILMNTEFQLLRNYYHHNSSIYEHVNIVSFISYKICKYLHFDFVSAARGALLHDFFLYDWRNHEAPDLDKNKYHGTHHPKIAYNNSLKHFDLNKVEKDIILKHMWPLTIIPPLHKESFLVSFVDKLVASKEYMNGIYTSLIRK